MSTTNAESTPKHKRPATIIRLGRLGASIFPNDTDTNRTFYTVSFSRSYRDANGNTKYSDSSFSVQDLAVVRSLARRAEDWIVDHTAPNGDES